MKIFLSGHSCKYAVEQMLFTIFPGEHPEYMAEDAAADLSVRLSEAQRFATATCSFKTAAGRFRGRAAVSAAEFTDDIRADSLRQHIIKEAMYRAFLAFGAERPPWGELTGVRPGKLMRPFAENGTRESAIKEFVREYDVSQGRAELCYDSALHTVSAAASLAEKDVCLYIGIPFCPTRCAYCSFVSQAVEKNMKLIAPFLSALEKEIAAVAEQVSALGLRPVSVYMGGGTPTTLSPEQSDALLTVLEREFDLSGVREFTVEAGRPDTITAEKLSVLSAHGVDRVSVNPQTMDNAVLEAIGRRHTADDILRALALVRENGSFSVNMDLIAGLPQDSAAGFKTTVDTVLSLAPENITVHTLSLKKGSGLMAENGVLPSAPEVREMLDYGYARLREAGYGPYYLYRQKNMSGGFENTGWARPGTENLYNICIMEELCSILAMGGGGSTKLISAGNGRNIRLMAPKYPLEYIQRIDATCADKAKISAFYSENK